MCRNSSADKGFSQLCPKRNIVHYPLSDSALWFLTPD